MCSRLRPLVGPFLAALFAAGCHHVEPGGGQAAPVRATPLLASTPVRYTTAFGCTALAHAADYRWVVGVLLAGREPDSWVVRYATGPDDRYGGLLELVNPGPMSGFVAGQMVR